MFPSRRRPREHVQPETQRAKLTAKGQSFDQTLWVCTCKNCNPPKPLGGHSVLRETVVSYFAVKNVCGQCILLSHQPFLSRLSWNAVTKLFFVPWPHSRFIMPRFQKIILIIISFFLVISANKFLAPCLKSFFVNCLTLLSKNINFLRPCTIFGLRTRTAKAKTLSNDETFFRRVLFKFVSKG